MIFFDMYMNKITKRNFYIRAPMLLMARGHTMPNDASKCCYDLSRFKYVNSRARGEVICLRHSEIGPISFMQSWSCLNKVLIPGCSACGGRLAKTRLFDIQQFLEELKEAHKVEYELVGPAPVSRLDKVRFKCRKGHIFINSPNNIVQYGLNGCNRCKKTRMAAAAYEDPIMGVPI